MEAGTAGLYHIMGENAMGDGEKDADEIIMGGKMEAGTAGGLGIMPKTDNHTNAVSDCAFYICFFIDYKFQQKRRTNSQSYFVHIILKVQHTMCQTIQLCNAAIN